MLISVPRDSVRIPLASKDQGHRILLIAGDADRARHMRQFLAEHRMAVKIAADESAGIGLAANGAYDLVLLDASLPRLSGMDVLRLIRARCGIPVVMLTGAAPGERIMALEMGADDCLSTPFNFLELIARVRAVLRRYGRGAPAPGPIEIRSVRIDPGSREVRVSGRRVELTSAEYVILETLMRAAGLVVTRERLAW